MYIAITVLIVIVSFLLILIVLVQNSKGGGLASSFASSNQIMGVKKTTDFLEKATWTLAGGLLVLCIFTAFVIPRGAASSNGSAIQEQVLNAPSNQVIPTFPGPGTGTPATGGEGATQEALPITPVITPESE